MREEYLVLLLDPLNFPEETMARIEAILQLENHARMLGWENWKLGFCKDEIANAWRAWLWVE